jgi:hypothetical protein
MDEYIGLDVSLKETSISVRLEGKRVWRGKCALDPQLLAEVIRKHAPHAKQVVFETGCCQCGSFMHCPQKGYRRIASMRGTPRLRSTWRLTRPTPTMPMARHTLPKLASTAKCV